jgi:hypothetical protein
MRSSLTVDIFINDLSFVFQFAKTTLQVNYWREVLSCSHNHEELIKNTKIYADGIYETEGLKLKGYLKLNEARDP